MNSRTTWWLVTLAAGLCAFIFFYERHLGGPGGTAQPDLLLPRFSPALIASIEVLRSNQVIRVVRTNNLWYLASPVSYAAQPERIEQLLETVRTLKRQALFSDAELLARDQASLPVGINPPRAILVLNEKDGRRVQFDLGDFTPSGAQVYFQLIGTPSILLGDAKFFDRLPSSANEWRDTTLLPLHGLNFNRVELRSGTYSYELQLDPTNQVWQLTKPQPPARADNTKVLLLLHQLQNAQISQFVPAGPRVDLESFGLQPWEAELAFGQATNDLLVVQFGKSPTNAPDLVYARLPGHADVVLVAKSVVDLVRVPPTEFRDRRLVPLPTTDIELVEAQGAENFTLRHQTNHSWRITEPIDVPADDELVQEFLATSLPQLEIVRFVKDVVTDFSPYGLAKPSQRYILKTTATNTTITNQIVAQIEFGTILADTIYARRADETSVYEVGLADFYKLPRSAYQMRDRRIWNFAPSNVVSVTIFQQGQTRKLLRQPNGMWLLSPPDKGNINPFSPEVTVQDLGRLRAESWIGSGDLMPKGYGFAEEAHTISIEVLANGQTQTFTVEFGKMNLRQNRYAATRLEGHRMIFEFPRQVYEGVLRDFTVAPLSTAQ
ncbi:MAG: DUF4340 domain-containing protein [Verrucomicrobiota bacterium]